MEYVKNNLLKVSSDPNVDAVLRVGVANIDLIQFNNIIHLFDDAQPLGSKWVAIGGGGGGGSHNDGNILYVSKGGDNGTAVKGDPTLPWADPWAAAAVAVSGDQVHVFTGTWTYALTGFGADVEKAAITDFNLHVDGVSWYFEPKATLHFIDTNDGSGSLFKMTTIGEVCEVYGHLTWKSDNFQNWSLVDTFEDALVHFEFDELYLDGYSNVIGYFEFGSEVNGPARLFVKGNRVIGSGGVAFEVGDRAGKSEGLVVYDIQAIDNDLNYVYFNTEGNYYQSIKSARINGSVVVTSGDSDSYLTVGNLYNNFSPLELGGEGDPTQERSIVVNIGVLENTNDAVGNTATLWMKLGYPNGTGTSTFRQVTSVHVGSAIFHGTVGATDAEGISIGNVDELATFNISGNYYATNGGHLQIGVNTGGETLNAGFIVDISKMKLVKTGTSETDSVTNLIALTPAVPVICNGYLSNEPIGLNITKIGTELVNVGIK